ncbi:MAG: crosslink repair DNA glycosylase YcaQ family protein, partial [Lapillicoccus sp.]
MRTVTDAERRARLGRRQAVAPRHRVADVESATRATVALHATEAPSVHLAAAARVDGLTVADVDRALFQTRTLVKQLAMRRTLFVFPRDLLPAAVGSWGARVAAAEQGRLIKDMVAGGLSATLEAAEQRLGDAQQAVLVLLAGGAELTTREIGEQVPETAGRVLVSAGTAWESSNLFAPRVLTLLGARGRIVRGSNDLLWRQSRYHWAATDAWLGEPLAPTTPEQGWAELACRYLGAFGPATEDDVVWWLGSTKTAVRRALADVKAVAVE